MNRIQSLIDNYYAWLKDKTALKNMGNWTEITTPYIDRHNDCIQIYLKEEKDGLILTDDGFTINSLLDDGCNLDTDKRRQMLRTTLNGYGVTFAEKVNTLSIKASPDNFPLKKHNLIQAILSVNDMFYTSSSHVRGLFLDDVKNWLEINEIRYSPEVSFIGRSGFNRRFEFIIPKSSRAPERIIKTINNPNKDSADNVLMDWEDTKSVRPEESKFYVFMNDNDKNVNSSIMEALRNYSVVPVLWSQREDFRSELAA